MRPRDRSLQTNYVGPVSVHSEREERETDKGPLPSQAFFSSLEGKSDKLGVLGCTLLLPIPGVGRAVPGCRSSEEVFAPWPWVLQPRLLVGLWASCVGWSVGSLRPVHPLWWAGSLLLGKAEIEGFSFLFPESAGLSHFLQCWTKQTLGWVYAASMTSAFCASPSPERLSHNALLPETESPMTWPQP